MYPSSRTVKLSLLLLCLGLFLAAIAGCGGTPPSTPAAPVISSFTATSATISAGASATLNWSVTGASSLSIDNGVGTVTGSSTNVSPTSTTTYTLTATNSAGATATAKTSVTVTVASGPVISSFLATPSTVTSGTSSLLSWTVTNATTLSIDNGIGTLTGTSVNVTPTATTTYTLTATSAAGTATAKATVTVAPPPTISSFVATPSSITSGAASVLSWTVTNATTLSINNGVGTVTGTSVPVAPTATTTYTLTATNSAGTIATSTATITVVVPGQLALLAGTVGYQGSTPTFDNPAGNAVDSSGNVYVVDTGSNTIEKVTPAGVVTTFAGSGLTGSLDGTGTAATFNKPMGIAVDTSNNLYVTDTNNQTIRKITPGGVVTTLAGYPGVGGTTDGTGSAATFSYPVGIAVDTVGNLFVTEDPTSNKPIRKITSSGVVTTLTGFSFSSTSCVYPTAKLQGIAVDAADNLYTANDSQICKSSLSGVGTFIAGGYPPGSADGTGSNAQFNSPTGVTLDSYGNLYVTDTGNATVRKITPAGVVTTLAGLAGSRGSVDSTGSSARFSRPLGISVDANGNLYVNDTSNSTIRKITAAGIVTTLAGSAGSQGSMDGTGTAARFSDPTGIAVDSSGTVYVADSLNSTIRKVSPAGVVVTFAGTAGTLGSTNSFGSTASFKYPTGVAVDASGNVYVADSGSGLIRKITQGGAVTTLAPVATTYPASSGKILGITVDTNGNVYATENNFGTIYKITQAGVVTILAGERPGELPTTEPAPPPASTLRLALWPMPAATSTSPTPGTPPFARSHPLA